MILKKNAFTLAEILITLAIIGVVAALTIPALVQKYQERSVVSKLQKAYATLSQAWQLDVNPLCGQGANNAMIILSKYMKISKFCMASSAPNCAYLHARLDNYIAGNVSVADDIDDEAYKQDAHSYAFLANGDAMAIYPYSADCSITWGTGKLSQNICFAVYYDINGRQKPNVWGKDYFIFLVGKNGVVPIGTKDSTAHSFSTRCKNDTEFMDGFGCAGWVIENKNLDYLHCDGLSWDGKRSCNDK